jgi:hypothetical protein
VFRHWLIAGVVATLAGAVPASAAFAGPTAPGRTDAGPAPVAAPSVVSVTAPAAATVAAVPAAPVAAPSGDPAAVDALTRSVAALDTLSHNVQMTTAHAKIRASVDPAGGTGMLIDQEGSSQFAETVLHGQVWLKLNIDPNTNKQLGITPNTWMSLDPAKLPKKNALPIPPDASDPLDMPGIFSGINSVQQDSANQLSGTIDLTKIAGRNRPDPNEVRQAGAAAKKVPYTLTLDGQHRISEFIADASGFDPGLSANIKYGSWGVEPNVKAPSSSVPAPDALYTVLAN